MMILTPITAGKTTSSGEKSPTVITEPFNDELKNELQAASRIHTGPIKLTSGYDGVKYNIVPAEFVHDVQKGTEVSLNLN
ncbi:hypothetical protein E4U30_007965 [Claviceps sp. LM220 group G6]|nr:hypothetical protein E4U30_007965 [Claviceps sp. LM220 group G6]KAG6095009.1 hypothetical protein E4U14_008339 [Claviceps sp. LM454 group G7]